MSTISKERVKDILEFGAGRIISPITDDEIRELARIALASLEAKSRKLFTCSGCSAEGLDEPLESKCHCNEDGAHWVESVVYTAPPAPVSVPDEDLLHMAASAIEDLLSNKDRSGAGVWADVPAKLRRTAMLHGANGNSPVIPDGWVACSERMPEENAEQEVLACFKGGDISTLYYFEGRWDDSYGIVPIRQDVTHWMPLPAAPQQEVKP